MIKRTTIITILFFFWMLPVSSQVEKKEEPVIRREVTLYNPYKPSLNAVNKRSFLPEMNDTMKVRPQFSYDVTAEPFLPEYTISPLKAAALMPDPLPKLYKSFVNIGLGNYITPLAEISITNERSKKGAIGFYGRHLSSNGNVELQNGEKAYAGYMDNDVSLFGKKFFRKSLFESSVDLLQMSRHAYGYDTSIVNYSPEKKDIRLGYYNIGANASYSSLKLDSSDFAWDFDLYYNFFNSINTLNQHNAGASGFMAKSYKGFYAGATLAYDYYGISDSLMPAYRYIASLSPFIKKSSEQWGFKLGFQLLADRNIVPEPEVHLYPDLDFSFSIVPSYIYFFTSLSGKLERNDPLNVIRENPFLTADGTLFRLKHTDHELIAKAGLKGNTGLDGNYLVSVSYSLISDMLLFTNKAFTDNVLSQGNGNYFTPLYDDAELLKIHGEMNGVINDEFKYNAGANLYRYNPANYDYAWNKPSWDMTFGLKYNLKDKIIAGMDITAIGDRKLVVNGQNINSSVSTLPPEELPLYFNEPVHFNLNLKGEYRYSKILSFWTKFNNISYNRYYEWAYYPSQRFLFMLGFTYSL
jgi:hypothetical protein